MLEEEEEEAEEVSVSLCKILPEVQKEPLPITHGPHPHLSDYAKVSVYVPLLFPETPL